MTQLLQVVMGRGDHSFTGFHFNLRSRQLGATPRGNLLMGFLPTSLPSSLPSPLPHPPEEKAAMIAGTSPLPTLQAYGPKHKTCRHLIPSCSPRFCSRRFRGCLTLERPALMASSYRALFLRASGDVEGGTENSGK